MVREVDRGHISQGHISHAKKFGSDSGGNRDPSLGGLYKWGTRDEFWALEGLL